MNIRQIIKAIIPKPLWNKLRMLRLRYTLDHYRRRVVRHSYGGHELELELVDPMGAGWYDHDWPELAEVALLRGVSVCGPAHACSTSERTSA